MKKILALITIVTLVSCGSVTSTEKCCENPTMGVDSTMSIDTTSSVVDTTMIESK